METHVAVFKALSDATRLRIMAVLVRAKGALCICEVVDALSMPQYAVSRHMKELKIAGLVKETKEGRFVFYSLTAPVDVFHRRVIETLKVLEAGVLIEDGKRLECRLARRAVTVPEKVCCRKG